MNPPPSLPSGWLPDPHGRYDYRWFNGTAWTADVSDDGKRMVDPNGAAPTPGSTGGQNPTGNGIATAAITCGLIAVLFAWAPVLFVIGLVLGVLALVFGIRGLRRSATVGSGRGRALVGAISGGTALLLSIVGVILTVGFYREFEAFLSPGPVEAVVVACTIEPSAIVIDATLTNRSDAAREYTVYAVMRSPAGLSDLVEEIPELAPGETTEFEMRRVRLGGDNDSNDDGDGDDACEARLVVHGPTPYGWKLERFDEP